MLKSRIKRNLASITRKPIQDQALRQAAVVVAVMQESEDQSPSFLLTRRATKMRAHPGQFALPGGKLDPGESAEQAALRELHEELGIAANNANVLGVLDDYPTRSGYCITPIVVWLEQPVAITPNPGEVAKVFHITIDELKQKKLINLEPGDNADNPIFSINLPTVGHEIYAPTAAIIYQFYQAAINGNNTPVAFYDEPRFARK